MRTILVPLDGSELAEKILVPARALATATQARLVLVRGVPFAFSSREQEVAAHAALSEALDYVEAVSRRLQSEGVTAEGAVLPGSPEQAILFAAQMHHVDLIAMSTHGRSGLRHALVGSVAEAVLRHGECPVLLSRSGAEPAPEGPVTHRILIPLDGSVLSESALAYLASEQLAVGARVLLLRVVEPPSLAVTPLGYAAVTADFFAEADRQTAEERQEAEAYLSAMGERYLRGMEWEKHVTTGYASDAILRAVGELHAGLIVMATAGRHGFERLLYGSVAGRVLRHAPVPILLVHEVSTP
ncbi:MAG TPA: universal stress protein [Chloroflexota bacterium]|nr:universal stress protein [Chloroflexota bacterium]